MPKPDLVIHSGGTGEAKGGATDSNGERTLVLAKLPESADNVQLGLPLSLSDPGLVVLFSLEGMAFHEYSEKVEKYRTRVIVDTRLSPRFRGLGFEGRSHRRFLEEREITYERWPVFANRYVGGSADKSYSINQYTLYLDTVNDELDRLAERLESGPSMILWSSISFDGVAAEALLSRIVQRSDKLRAVIEKR